ncbi:hypothetical protein ABDD95_03660 [Mucilaginibacter sp. PAMB04274]|uniref:hypothetical protein n=1 Tax=Mucilaginibacter sp. PAMB04274 TaxID=3138568 RepID=UPI0031F61902
MQQDISHNPTDLLKQVLSSTAKLTDAHRDSLQTLLYSFPQCGVLHAIQARLGNATQLSEAAAWFGDSMLLQKVIKSPEKLPAVSPAQIIFKENKIKARPAVDVAEAPVIVTEPAVQPATEAFVSKEPEPADAYENIKNDAPVATPDAGPVAKVESNDRADQPLRPIFKDEPLDETQQLIIESIAANDYFVFDQAFVERNQPNPEPEVLVQPVAEPKVEQPTMEEGQVTRYHDDKMPYSFLWWLDKTRSKHSSMYRPYAGSTAGNSLRPVTESKPEAEEHKTDDIVDRFIQEEPQMKPPTSDKIDTENKAKHSAEDQEELITETLARIYADQMLYSKAIAAYKILMLKNPEKRRYFASQIEVLEKKIN